MMQAIYYINQSCLPYLSISIKSVDEVEIEIEGNEAQEEAELQITAAVMEFTGDSDTEETETHDEDYSSYELDDSDAVLGKQTLL